MIPGYDLPPQNNPPAQQTHVEVETAQETAEKNVAFFIRRIDKNGMRWSGAVGFRKRTNGFRARWKLADALL